MGLLHSFILESDYFEKCKEVNQEFKKAVVIHLNKDGIPIDKSSIKGIGVLKKKRDVELRRLESRIRVHPGKEAKICLIIFRNADYASLLEILRGKGIELEQISIMELAAAISLEEIEQLPGIQPIHVRRLLEMVEVSGLKFKEENLKSV